MITIIVFLFLAWPLITWWAGWGLLLWLVLFVSWASFLEYLTRKGTYTMSARKGGILRRMSEVKDMYKLAHYVHSDRYAKDAQKNPAKSDLEAHTQLMNLFANKLRLNKMSKRKAGNIMLNTEKHKFIELNHSTSEYWFDVVHGKGMQLIAKSWGRRVGLREITMKEYPRTTAMYKARFVAVVAAVGTIVGAVSGAVVTYVLSHK